MRTINHSNVPETNPRLFRTWWASLLTIAMVALSFATGTVSAQSTANYTFATGADASLALDMNANAVDMTTGTTSLVASGSDQGVSSVTNIGFPFFLNGLPYTQFTVSANGVMQLGSTSVSSTTYVASGGSTTSPKLGALTADMITASSADGGGVTSKVVGTAPNRTLVVQWVDYVYWLNSSPAATWQIRLYESTGVIEYVYGSMSVGATAYSSGYTTGFSTGTAANTLASVTTSANTNSTTAFATNSYTANTAIANLNSAANGSRRYYRYTPPTPASNPTALNFTAVTATGMTLNWTAASPTTGTVRYAVYLSTDGGTTYNYNNNTALGTNLLAITGLVPSTTYFWRVYSVSEGVLSSSFASGSQATAAAASYTWNNTGSGIYGTGSNWTPTRTTASSTDILIFDGTTTPNPTVTGFTSQTIGQLRLINNANVNFASSASATLTISGGGSGTDFDIPSGSTLNLNGTSSIGVAFTGTNRSVNIAGTLRTSTTGTGTVNFTNSLATVSGTLDLSSTTNAATSNATNLTIGATGTVICGSNSVVIPTATWNAASNLNITGAVGATSATGAAQNFGNVTYNCAGSTATMSFFTSGTVTIQNLTVTNTNTGRFRALTSGTLTVGNITLNGGTLEIASTSGTANVSGNVTVNGGLLDITSGTGAATLKIAGTYNQTGGTLNVSGTSTTSVMEFNGTVAQNATFGIMGTGAVRVRVNNAAGVNLSGTLAINTSGALIVSNGNITGAGTIAYNATGSNLIYNGTAGAQTATAVEFPGTNGPASLTINNTATSPNNVVSVPFARSLGSAGVLTLTAGILDNGSNTLTIANTATGGISGGSASAYVRGSLERTLPASLASGSTYAFPIGQAAYNAFELVNPTTGAGTTSVVAQAFDGSTGGTAGTLMATISSTRYWSVSQNLNPSNLTNTFIRLNDTRGTQDGIANSATLTGAYDHIGGAVSTLASGSITTTAPALTSLSGYYLMGNLAGPTLSGLAASPSSTQLCLNAARTVTIDVTPGAGAINTVTLNYQVNGGANNSVSMTNTGGTTWSGTIPTVTPANATVTWSVTAVDANGVNQSATGTSYKDEPLFNLTSTVAASATTVCAGSPTILTGSFTESGNTVAVGAGGTNSSAAGISFFPGSWGGAKTQYIIRASELTAAGMTAGSTFSSLQYEVTVVGQTYQGFAVSLGLTTQATATTTFINTGLTQVYRGTLTDDGYLPVVGVNTLAFGTGSGSISSFTWDGTSNIVVSICWSRVPAASTSTSSTMKVDAPGFTCTSYDQSDLQTPAAECALTTADATGSSRPKFTFIKAPKTYSAYAWSDGSSIVGTTNPLTVNPTTTTTYTLTATETVSGCTLVSSNTVTVNVNALPAAPSTAPSSQCGTGVPTCFAVGTSNGNYRWYLTSTGGTALAGEVNDVLGSYSISTTTTFYVAITNGTCESLRTPVTAIVNAPDAVSASATALACVNGAFALTATVTSNSNGNVYNYTWTATPATGSGIPTTLSGGTGTFGTPTNTNVTPTAAGTYTYTVTATDATLGCATTASTTVTVNALPIINTPTATPNEVCAGAPVTLAATTSVIAAGNVTIGTATTLTGATSQPTAFCNRWPSYRMQTLFTAAELQAAGMVAGNITSMSFNITTLGDGATNANFIVKIGTTTSTAMTTFENNAGYTTVFPSQTYTHAVGVNTINFSTPFNWNGTSNIIVEVQHNGADLTNNSQTYYTATTGNTVAYTLTDATNSASLSNNRLNVVFGAQTQTTGTGGLTWTWTPGVLSGASVTVNPTTTTTYTVTALNTTTGCANTANVAVTVNEIPADPSTNGSEQCGTSIPTASVSSNSSATTPTFKWYTTASGGSAVQTSTATTYLSTVSTTTTFYVSEISSFGCESGRTPVTVVVSDPDVLTVTTTAPTGGICPGVSFDLSSSYTPDFNSFATFDLTATGGAASGVVGTVSLTPNATGSDAYTITPSAAGTYTYTVSAFDPDKGCTSVGTVTVTVNPNPPAISAVSATPATICAGQSAVLSAVILGGSATGTIGTGTVSNTTSTPYKGFWGGNKQQMLYTAAELSSLGLAPGSIISSVGFNITAFTSPYTFNGFTIAMKNTTSTVLTTTLETGTTTVFGPTNYTLTGTAPFAVNHTLTTPFAWDGTSNLLVEFCFNNNNGGGVSANSANVASSTTATNLTVYYSADNTATVCSAPGTGSLTTTRPNLRIGYTPNSAASYDWSWDNGGGSSATVTVSPTTTTTYIATAFTPGTTCSTASSPVTVTVNPLPAAPTTNDPVTRCGPGSVTMTASGSGGTLNWYTVSTGGTAVSTGPSYTVTVAVGTVTYYVAETSAAGCEGPRTAVTVTASTPPTLAITPGGATTFCAGGNVSLDAATGSDPSYNTFSWTPSTGLSATNVASVTATPSVTTTYTVTATNLDGCINTASVTITVNPNPAIGAATATPATICVGGNASLTTNSTGPNTAPGTYCTADASGGAGSNPITNVTFGNINNTQSTQVSPYSYTYPASGTTTTTVYTGQSYDLTVTSGTASIASVWFDWNRNGVYESSEWTQLWTSASTGTISVAVPSNASAGLTGMRIRTRGTGNTNGSTDACSSFFSGTSQDYLITVIGGPNAAYNYTWNPGAISGATITVSPTSTTTYSVTASDPVTGCTTVSNSVTVTVQTVGATASASPATPVCAGTSVTLNGGATGGGPFTYVWNDGTSNFSTAASPVVSPTVTTTYTVIVTDLCGNPSAPSSVTVVVNPLPTASIQEAGPITICQPATQTLTAVTDAATPAYQWTLNGVNIPSATGSTYTINTVSTGAYRVIVTNTTTNCVSAVSAPVTVTLNAQPAAVTIAPTAATICNGSNVTLTASGGTTGGSGNAILGTATTLTSATSQPTAFCNRWSQYWNQTIYTAAELTAAGLSAGSSITSLTYNITTLGDAATNANYRVRIANTASNTLSAFQTTGFTTVYGPSTYTHAVGTNLITFTTPFVWNGTSNIIIDVRHDGIDNLNNSQTYFTAAADNKNFTAFTSTTSATTSIETLVANATVTGSASTTRLNVVLGYSSLQNPTWSWTPTTGLATSNTAAVVASPSTTTTYTATATNGFGCTTSSSPVTVTVNPRPTAVVSGSAAYCQNQPASTNLSIAFTGAGPWTYTLNGSDASTVTATTSSNPVTVTVSPNSAIAGVVTYTVTALSDANCAAIGADLTGSGTVTINPLAATPTATVTQPTCVLATGSITMTAPLGAGNSYTLDGGTTITWPSVTFSGVAPGPHTITVTNSFGCSAPASASVTVNPQPFTPSAPTVSGPTNVCPFLGNSTQVTYTATAAGATSYNWILPPNVNIVSGAGTGTLVVTFNAAFGTQVNKQIRVTASSICGTSSQTLYYLLVQFPSTPAPIVASTLDVCSVIGTSNTITFTIPKVAGASSYIWTSQAGTTVVSHPNGLGVNDTTITVSFSNAFTTSAITVTAVNDCGTSGTRSITLTKAAPSTPSPISGPTNACAFISPSTTAATYTVPAQANASSYTWTLPVGATNVTGQGTNTISFIYPAGYTGGTISVTASNGCGTSSARSLTIATLSPATPSVIDVINTAPCPERVYTYSVAAMPANATSLNWTVPAAGTIVSGQGTTSITVSYPATAVSGTVTVAAVNNCGSSVVRSVDVKLPACPPPAFTSTSNAPSKGTSVAPQVADLDVTVFPNPTVSDFKLQVQTASKEIIHVRVLDITGREYKVFQLVPGSTLSLGRELKAGSYILEVRQGKSLKTTKVLKF